MFKIAGKEGVIVKETIASKTQSSYLHQYSMKGVLKTFQVLVTLKVLLVERRAMVLLGFKGSHKKVFIFSPPST